MPTGKAKDSVTFPVDLQMRLFRLMEAHADELSIKVTRYLPYVLNGYRDGRAVLPRPGSQPAPHFPKGKPGQQYPIKRFPTTYQRATVDWLVELGQRAGGFKRNATVIYLLLDWFRLNPMPHVYAGKTALLPKQRTKITPSTTMRDRTRGALTIQKRLATALEKIGDPMTPQQYLRVILATYAKGEAKNTRPKTSFEPLRSSKGRREYAQENISLHFSPPLLQWIDDIGSHAAGLNRSHIMLLLFLDWLQISPFPEVFNI